MRWNTIGIIAVVAIVAIVIGGAALSNSMRSNQTSFPSGPAPSVPSTMSPTSNFQSKSVDIRSVSQGASAVEVAMVNDFGLHTKNVDIAVSYSPICNMEPEGRASVDWQESRRMFNVPLEPEESKSVSVEVPDMAPGSLAKVTINEKTTDARVLNTWTYYLPDEPKDGHDENICRWIHGKQQWSWFLFHAGGNAVPFDRFPANFVFYELTPKRSSVDVVAAVVKYTGPLESDKEMFEEEAMEYLREIQEAAGDTRRAPVTYRSDNFMSGTWNAGGLGMVNQGNWEDLSMVATTFTVDSPDVVRRDGETTLFDFRDLPFTTGIVRESQSFSGDLFVLGGIGINEAAFLYWDVAGAYQEICEMRNTWKWIEFYTDEDGQRYRTSCSTVTYTFSNTLGSLNAASLPEMDDGRDLIGTLQSLTSGIDMRYFLGQMVYDR